MKKLLITLLVVVLCVACVGLVACGSGDIHGTYKLYSVEYAGTTYVIGTAEATEMGLTANDMILVVNSDGTAAIKNYEVEASHGTWVLEGNSFIMTIYGETEPQTFTVSGNTITINVDGKKIVLKKA